MPDYFATTPPREKKRPSRIANESAKHREKRLASPPKFRKPISRSLPPGAPKTAVKICSENVKTAKRKRASYAKKLAAYKRSECYKLVERRSAGQCEALLRWTRKEWIVAWRVEDERRGYRETRCTASRGNVWSFGEKIHHHHLTYARFGGDELPEDIRVLCTRHHDEAELKSRPWNKGRGFGGKTS